MKKRLSVSGKKRGRNVIVPPTLVYMSNSSGSRTGKRARICLRPWMEDLLDNKTCQVLRWVDKHLRIFSIAWRHASSIGFDPSFHGDLFYRWAKHTGKLDKNTEISHTSQKSNFRCALNSLPDCIQLTKSGDKKGEKAKRTYQFINSDHPLYDIKKKQRQKNNKIQPKEETCNFSLVATEVETVPLKSEQEPSTWKSEQDPIVWDSEQDPIVWESDLETSTWGYLRSEVVSPAYEESLSSSATQFIVMEDIAVSEPSSSATQFIVMENVAVSEPSPPIMSPSMDTAMNSSSSLLSEDPDNNPCVPKLDDLLTPAKIKTSRKIITQIQPNGVIALELQNLDSGDDIVEQPVTPKNLLPVFTELGISEYETFIFHAKLNSGGSVKVQLNKPITLSQPELDPAMLGVLFHGNQNLMDDTDLSYDETELAEILDATEIYDFTEFMNEEDNTDNGNQMF